MGVSSSVRDGEASWVREVHRFWFGDQDVRQDHYEHLFKRWYRGGPAYDVQVRQRFLPLIESLAAEADSGRLSEREASARSRLALVIVLDQMSRNMFRGSARMFAFDAIARPIAERALDAPEDLVPVEEMFLAVALEHSEAIADVRRSAAIFARLVPRAPPGQRPRFLAMQRYNQQHLEIIERFGRYPHRNQLLGRETTPEEEAFLRTTRYGFMRSVLANTPPRLGGSKKS